MNELFQVHMLNDPGKRRAADIAVAFDDLLTKLDGLQALQGRYGAIVKTKLEEACFFAKKSMASQPINTNE